jgi:cytochrome P450
MLPDSIPCVADAGDALTDPIRFLARSRASYGNLFAIRKDGPMFSRAPECAGVVAAFGMENQRAALTDMATFGLPISAAEKMRLPRNLVNLNRSLHSMQGAEHAAQKRLLIGILNRVEPLHRSVWTVLEEVAAQWTPGPVELVQQMRELIFHASSRLLFGDGGAATRQLASLLQIYFHLRREAASAGATPNQEALEQLVAVGNSLDSQLRDYIRECCRISGSSSPSPGVLANMATESGDRLSEDEIVGHMNVFFISTTEPVAIAASWVLLVLSQLPQLRIELRKELDAALEADSCPTAAQMNGLGLLDSVINETLRILPPNALMVRITTKPTALNGMQLPSGCEVLLSPFISHRDETIFSRPDEFLPERWLGSPPSPFVYFPFGAGGHACVGRSLALDMIKTSLAFLLPRFDVLLTQTQEIDLSIRIMLMPDPDPQVIFHPLHSQSLPQPGMITGALAKSLSFKTKAAP